jgi:hypothetical protein
MMAEINAYTKNHMLSPARKKSGILPGDPYHHSPALTEYAGI